MSHNAAITQIMEQAEVGNLEGVKAKLRVQPALLNIRDGDGRTPLHRAAESGNMELLEMLVEMGAIVNAENEQGHIPLHFGAFAGHVDSLSMLLDKGAWIDHIGKDGCVPLHFACGQGKLEAIEYLVERGANLKISNNKGEFPLHWALRNQHKGVAMAVNDMYTRRPANSTQKKVWPRRELDAAEITHAFVDNKSTERAAENKKMGLFFAPDNSVVRSHDVDSIEKSEVDALLDKHHPGTPF
jgi:ankyrin repeat protein